MSRNTAKIAAEHRVRGRRDSICRKVQMIACVLHLHSKIIISYETRNV